MGGHSPAAPPPPPPSGYAPGLVIRDGGADTPLHFMVMSVLSYIDLSLMIDFPWGKVFVELRLTSKNGCFRSAAGLIFFRSESTGTLTNFFLV